ncbi:hypothetical protein EV356DRAFT_568137 [Viridothelium virens]|uniref:Uncharacterized protein n=1 Tax=Viridothelium virens TaxID=1048519 RepID=A0A6A6H5A3_VIRVR|nr:hypothetical protein EV356DRAFT_568137 [Viridothelium virens]
MTDHAKLSASNTASNDTKTIENEKYEIRDSDPLFDNLDSVEERNHNRKSRPVWFKYKPVHNLQSTPKDKIAIKAVKAGIRRLQFVGHWAIQVGSSQETDDKIVYIWELWQHPNTHEIYLGEQNRGPVKWTNLRVIQTSTGKVFKTKETLKDSHWWHKCGNTTMTDLEIRDKAIHIINNLSTEDLGPLDRLMRWRALAELKVIERLFGKRARGAAISIFGFQGKLQSEIVRRIREIVRFLPNGLLWKFATLSSDPGFFSFQE